MLGTADNITVVADWLTAHRPPFVVLDPVMVATSGDRLLDPDAEQAIRALLPLADVITPNLAELAVLVDEQPVADLTAAIDQGRRLAARTGARVLVKGGHLPVVTDDSTAPIRSRRRVRHVDRRLGRPGRQPRAVARTLDQDEQHPRHRLLALLRPGRASTAAGQLGRGGGGCQGVALRRAGRLRPARRRLGRRTRSPPSSPLASSPLAGRRGRPEPATSPRKCGPRIAPDPRGHRNDALHPGAGRRLRCPGRISGSTWRRTPTTCGSTPAAWPGWRHWRRTRMRRNSSRMPPPVR